MKRIKRVFMIVFSIILVGFIVQQLYYRISYNGNLMFYISNESIVDSVQLEVFVDGTKVVDDKVTNKFSHLYKLYSVKTTLNNHVVIVKMNGEATEEIKINTFRATFIIVEYHIELQPIPDDQDRKYFHINVKKRPLRFIA